MKPIKKITLFPENLKQEASQKWIDMRMPASALEAADTASTTSAFMLPLPVVIISFVAMVPTKLKVLYRFQNPDSYFEICVPKSHRRKKSFHFQLILPGQLGQQSPGFVAGMAPSGHNGQPQAILAHSGAGSSGSDYH